MAVSLDLCFEIKEEKLLYQPLSDGDRQEKQMTYTKFQKLNIDTSPIGWEQTDSKEECCFCTPKGAKIIGRAGVDGIHYCTVRGFGSMIFAVSPMNLPGNYVHPIAENFTDFLRLLLACLNLNIIEQAWSWDEEQLTEQIEQVGNSEYFDDAPLKAIREKCGLEPMEAPFCYLYTLQRSFDYGSIPFTKEYYELTDADDSPWQPPEWKVTADGGFFEVRGKAGKEIVLNKTFVWNGITWHVPSAYLCKNQVVVVDFLAEIETDEYLKFRQDAEEVMNRGRLTEEEEEILRRRNPAGMMIQPKITVNGTELQSRRGRGETWIPQSCLDAGEAVDMRAKAIAEHYCFDLSKLYVIRRCSFPSETKIGEIVSLCLKMMGEAEFYQGIHFTDPHVGDSYTFTHPVRGTEHTLTVTEYDAEEMDQDKFASDEWIFPTHMTAMKYTVTPDLPRDEIGVRDCAHGDSPRRRESAPKPDCDFCSAIAVIRSSDGPSAVIAGVPQVPDVHSVCSSLHFERQDSVEWRVGFRVKTVEDMEVELL